MSDERTPDDIRQEMLVRLKGLTGCILQPSDQDIVVTRNDDGSFFVEARIHIIDAAPIDRGTIGANTLTDDECGSVTRKVIRNLAEIPMSSRERGLQPMMGELNARARDWLAKYDAEWLALNDSFPLGAAGDRPIKSKWWPTLEQTMEKYKLLQSEIASLPPDYSILGSMSLTEAQLGSPFKKPEPTEGERLAAFFARSEHGDSFKADRLSSRAEHVAPGDRPSVGLRQHMRDETDTMLLAYSESTGSLAFRIAARDEIDRRATERKIAIAVEMRDDFDNLPDED